jgi:hypothetical protein
MSLAPRYAPIPLHRRWINEVVHFGKKSHVVGCNWTINLAAVVAARAAHQPAVGWTAIWMKALALVSRRRSELRTAYLPFPWARFYVHPHSVAAVTIERTWRGVPAVFFEQFRRPDCVSLWDLDASLRALRQVPVESVGSFRRLIRFSRPPLLLRRAIWGITLHWSGRLRSKYFGTFAINPFPTPRGSVMQSTTPVTMLLYYGLVDRSGDTLVQLLFDHRVLDGVEAYRLIRDVEATLKGEIVAELTRGPAAILPAAGG